MSKFKVCSTQLSIIIYFSSIFVFQPGFLPCLTKTKLQLTINNQQDEHYLLKIVGVVLVRNNMDPVKHYIYQDLVWSSRNHKEENKRRNRAKERNGGRDINGKWKSFRNILLNYYSSFEIFSKIFSHILIWGNFVKFISETAFLLVQNFARAIFWKMHIII